MVCFTTKKRLIMKKSINRIILPFLLSILVFGSCGEGDEEDNQDNITPVMVFSDRDGVWGLDQEGTKKLITDRIVDPYILDFGVEVLNGLLYVQNNYVISVYNLSGNLIEDIEISEDVSYPLDFCILPDSSFAFLDNENDKVSFTSASGEFITEVHMKNPSPEELQNVDAVVVDSNLVVSNTGDGTVMKINLYTFESLIHSIHTKGSLDYNNGNFYCGDVSTIYKFLQDSPDSNLLCTLPEGNITGIATDNKGRYAYITMNFGNKIYVVDLENGDFEIFITGLSYPNDIEWIK